jgi:antitoxin (DNA-binding transcriptional repressor) of toxin-antitoxin stability system
MRKLGLKILKNKLSEFVRLAAASETVVITDRDRAVAEIVPPRRDENESFLERGVREGWLTPAMDRSGHPPPRKPIPGYKPGSKPRTRATGWKPPPPVGEPALRMPIL